MKDIEKIKSDLINCESKIKNIESTSVKVLQEIFQVAEIQRNIIQEIMKPNICPYCNKNNTDSIDPNVFCYECRESFGHCFMSEL